MKTILKQGVKDAQIASYLAAIPDWWILMNTSLKWLCLFNEWNYLMGDIHGYISIIMIDTSLKLLCLLNEWSYVKANR